MLPDIYREYQRRGSDSGVKAVADHFYPPLLVRPDASWKSAQNRLAWIGQETFGPVWNFGRENAQPLDHLSDFFAREDAVDVLLAAYTSVEGTFGEPQLPRGPFWSYLKRTFDQLAGGGDTSGIWTNLIRCAADAEGSYALGSLREEMQAPYLAWQKGLIAAELKELNPTVAIFVTGPRYDEYLLSEFSGLRLDALPGFSEREVARLHHPELPFPAFRTYHPGYLNRVDRLEFKAIEAILKASVG